MSEVLEAPPKRQQSSLAPDSQLDQDPRADNLHAEAASATVQNDFASELLIFEAEVRAIEDERELLAHLCNSSRRVVGFRQCFHGTINLASNKFSLKGISSVSVVDKNVPFNLWIEKLVSRLLRNSESDRQLSFSLPAYFVWRIFICTRRRR